MNKYDDPLIHTTSAGQMHHSYQNPMLQQQEDTSSILYRDDAGQPSSTVHNESGTSMDQVLGSLGVIISDSESVHAAGAYSLSDNLFSSDVIPPYTAESVSSPESVHAASSTNAAVDPAALVNLHTEHTGTTPFHAVLSGDGTAGVDPFVSDAGVFEVHSAGSYTGRSGSNPAGSRASYVNPGTRESNADAVLLDSDDMEHSFADMLMPQRADIYAKNLVDAHQSAKYSGWKYNAYRAAIQGASASEDFSTRMGSQGKRAAVAGASMTYGAAKSLTKAVYRQGKFGVLSVNDYQDGLIEGKKELLLKNGQFAVKQGKDLLGGAGKRLGHEGLLLAEDFEGSEDLGVQAIVQTKNAIRDTKHAITGTKRLFGGDKQKSSVWQVLRRTPSAISGTVTAVGNAGTRIVSKAVQASRSLGMIGAVAVFMAILLMVVPAAYALTGAGSLAADDETLTQVYTYVTELDAKLSKKINDYQGKADVVSFYQNGTQTIDTIEIKTDPDPLLAYLDCVYGEYEFSEVKPDIDDIYSNLYGLDIEKYDQDVGSTSESETVVDPDTETGSDSDSDIELPGIQTYTPTYGGTVSKKPGSTLTTAILNNSTCLGTFKLTFYCGCTICSEQWGTQTATGATATEGRTIAVDPRVIPYGTKVHIDGFGDFIAEDCGGAIKGNRIDVFVSDHQRCNQLGVQYAAVYAMDSSITGGIYIPGISKDKVSHIDVKLTTQSMSAYLQSLLDDEQKGKSDLMNQLGQYTTHMKYGSPLENDTWSIAKRYGYYYDGSVNQHFGIDVMVSTGQKILAVSSGTVVETGTDTEHGTYLILENGKNRFLYGNLGTIVTGKGSEVERGDVIAKAGKSAAGCESSTVHIEYERDGTSLNPSFYLYHSVPMGVGSSDIVEVALSQLGQHGGQPYWSYMGFSSRVAWCASFVSWCANECGYIDAGIMPKTASCIAGADWYKARGQRQDRNYVPTTGDIIYFDFNNQGETHHIGIVEYVEGNIIHTVEGNASDSVARRTYTVGESDIYGYGIPQYP